MRLKAVLKAKGLLTVGCGYPQVFGADIQLYATSPGRPLIPGSTIKGALRSSACKIAPLLAMASCGEIEPSRIADKHREMGGVCDVCRIFGAPGGYRGLLRATPFKPLGKPRTIVIARVGIDDVTKKAGRGRLYSTEHYEPGQEFEGDITLRSDDADDIKFILAALANLRFEPFGRAGSIDVKVAEHDIPPEICEGNPAVAELLAALSDWLGGVP